MKRTHWLATTTLLLAATTAFPATVTLNGSTGDVTLQNGDVLTGTGGRNTYVTIAAGATVTLSGISIVKNETSTLHPAQIMKPAITCLGDATIVLAKGTVNTIRGGSTMDPCILPGPPNTTLTVKGYGSLVLRTLEMGACIGGSGWLDGTWEGGTLVSTTVHPIDCGNIVIEGGNLDLATGGGWAAAIGSGTDSSCGDITIRGGNIRAVAGYGAAIGTGWRGSCGDITITGGTVYAEQKTYRWSAPIGCSTARHLRQHLPLRRDQRGREEEFRRPLSRLHRSEHRRVRLRHVDPLGEGVGLSPRRKILPDQVFRPH